MFPCTQDQTTSRDESVTAVQSPPQKSESTVQYSPQKSVAAVQSPPHKTIAAVQSPPQKSVAAMQSQQTQVNFVFPITCVDVQKELPLCYVQLYIVYNRKFVCLGINII